MATLYVDSTHPSASDATSKASNSASQPWETIYRAMKGAAEGSPDDDTEAADAGDTVLIQGGPTLGSPVTYTFTGVIQDNFITAYSPVNQGTVGNLITIQAVGYVRLAAPNAESPLVGSNGQDYIKWYADHTTGNAFLIECYNPLTGSANAAQARVTPDTGPVVVTDLAVGCWFEGFRIDGGVDCTWGDNYPAFRLDGCVGGTFRNNYIENFTSSAGNDDHSTGFTLYGSRDNIIEHNHIVNCSAAFAFKDKNITALQSGNHLRYNRCEGTGIAGTTGVAFSHVTTNAGGGGEDRSQVYQNIFDGFQYGMILIGTAAEGLLNDWIYNNVFANCATVGMGVSYGSNTTGVRVWNNIVYDVGVAVEAGVGNIVMPAATVVSLEHNVYFTFTTFYVGSDASRAFGPGAGTYLTTYTDQDQATPDSVNSDPLFVNAATGDYHLQGGSPAIDLGRHPDTSATINAGCYLTGAEEIGLEAAADAEVTSGGHPVLVLAVL